MTNSNEIVEAFRRNLNRRSDIKTAHSKVVNLHNKMLNDIPEMMKIYKLVFRNIYPDKKPVCNIKNFKADDYSDYYDKATDFRKAFVNRDGISVSNSFNLTEEAKLDTSRTNYIHTYNSKGFIKILLRLFEVKDEIINALDKDYKKSIVARFFKAFEESGCNKEFDYVQDFDYYKEDANLKVGHYKSDKIETINIKFFEYKNASNSVIVSQQGTGWGGRTQIDFDDIEKCSQIFDELMNFFNNYYAHLERQDKSLAKFIVLLKDAFAKELVINSLEDKPK